MTRASRRQFGTLVLTVVLCSVPSQWVWATAVQSPAPITPSEVARLLAREGIVVKVPAEGKVKESIAKDAPTFALPDGASSVMLLQLPEYRGPYDLTVVSSRIGMGRTTEIFVPAGFYFDAEFQQAGEFGEDQLAGRGENMSVVAELVVGEAHREARYLLLYTRGDLVGQQVTIVEGQGPLHNAIASIFQKGRVFRFERALEASIEVAASAVPVARPPIGADRLLGGQPSPTSFEGLQSLPRFQRGVEVIVADEAGTATTGRISSVSSSQLVVTHYRSRWFRSPVPEEQTFAGDTVRTIKIVDATMNGKVIGGAAGALLGIAALRAWPDSSAFGRDPSEAVMAVAGIMWLGVGAGHLVDKSINQTIYQKPAHAPRVMLVPVLGRERRGVMAQVRF